MDRQLISRNNQEFMLWRVKGYTRVAKVIYEKHYPNINPFTTVCLFGDLEMAQWLLEKNPNIDLYEDDHYAFRNACLHQRIDVAKWLQSLKPYKYEISYNAKGKIINYKINSKKEERLLQRMYPLWLASNETPCKNNLLYRIPEDVSRYIIQMYL